MPGLNPEQKLAAEHGEGPLLVIAGPGTGKTRVITERIVYLLQNSAASSVTPALKPENVLALTFTEKAAGEMKHRVAAALPSLETSPHISTFHAFCLETLRKHHEDRRLLDKIDVWVFLRRRMAELGLEYYRKLAEPGAFLHDLNDFFSRCQDELIEPEDFDRYVRQRERLALLNPAPGERKNPDTMDLQKELARVFATSRRLIEASGASSLGSLVSEAVMFLKRDSKALEEVRDQYRAVLVDEFQDTNYAQVELLKLLAPPPYAITAVGDDDQAIYRFRGASFGAFKMFSDAFPGHRTVWLSRNYRSTKHILHAASAVIAHNDRYGNKPALLSSREAGAPIYLVKSKSAESEAAWTAEEIERLARNGTPYGGIAVLYRAHNIRDLLVAELARRHVPISIRGLSILSATVLRDLVAYLRVIHSPHDSISLVRVLLAPRWRFPETLAQTFRELAAKDHTSLYSAIVSAGGAARKALESTAWGEIDALLTTFRNLSRSVPVAALAGRLVERLGWPTLDGNKHQVYLETFSRFLREWEDKSETRKLPEFLEYFRYFLEAGGKVESPQPAERAVQLMTVHAAKGLEFPVVFVIGVSPRRFPPAERKPVIDFPADLRKGPNPPRDIHLQEERRLFFVAMTRAKDKLYVSSVSKSDRQQSVFVQDLLSEPAVRASDVQLIAIPDPAPSANAPVSGRPTRSASALERSTAARGGLDQSEPSPLRGRRIRIAHAGQSVADAVSAGGLAAQPSLFENAATASEGLHADVRTWATQTNVPAPDGDLRLSATAIDDYLGCPLKYKFQHVLNIPVAAQAPLTFGNLMHRAVRHYFELRRELALKGDGDGAALPSAAQVAQFYLERWKSAGFDDAYHEETYREAGLDQIKRFVEKQNALAMDASAIEMERGFEFTLGDITLDGRIDQINHLSANDGKRQPVELVDYKTGRPRTERDVEKSLQLSVYALAARETMELDPVRLTLYNLTNNQAVSGSRTVAELERAKDEIRRAAAQIRVGCFDATPGFLCRWCNYITLCPEHEG